MTVTKKALQRSVTSVWPLILLAGAGWSVLRWYVLRMTDGSDEPFGLIAVIASAWFAWREPGRKTSWRRLALATFGLAMLAVIPAGTPALVRALIWVGTFGAVAARSLARAGLLAYSLPVMASAQFFAGYPVRVAVTWAAAGLLRVVGLAVTPNATLLLWHREKVLIDAPCSGLQMAWLAGMLALLLANGYALNAKRTVRLLALSVAVTFLANVLRAAVLFFFETQLRVSAEWMHDAVGLFLFALVVSAVLACASLERDRSGLEGTHRGLAVRQKSEVERACHGFGWTRFRRKLTDRVKGGINVRGRMMISAAFLFSASCVAARPFYDAHRSPSIPHEEVRFPGWETAPIFHGQGGRVLVETEAHASAMREAKSAVETVDSADRGVRRIALDAKTERFAADFPGKIALFSDGQRTWIVRWVFKPTRKLHSASDCLRAAGYRVTPGRARLDADNALWSSFDAKRDGEDLRVCERIVGSNGCAWSDVSAWFWETFFDSDSGPWWAITELEPNSGVEPLRSERG